MLSYITLGTKDGDRAARFFDGPLNLSGASRVFENDSMIACGIGSGSPVLVSVKPVNSQPASVGNDVMAALTTRDKPQVDAMCARAIALGPADEDITGQRVEGFYAAYFREADGNKFAAYYSG